MHDQSQFKATYVPNCSKKHMYKKKGLFQMEIYRKSIENYVIA